MFIFYNTSVRLYAFGIRIASIFNDKAKLWIEGRKNLLSKIKNELKNSTNHIWIHCASLGEYEQAKPFIEKLKLKYPKEKIVVTFFSPSGYEYRKNDPLIDYCFYLPIDTISNAKKLVDTINPKMVFFVKYEFWINYINYLKKKNIPTYLISGVFRTNQIFFKWYGKWFKNVLFNFTHFFVQNEKSKALLHNHGIKNVTVSGDTRFDRVFENSKNPKPLPIIDSFKNNRLLLVGGSTWNEEEEILSKINSEIFKIIIAPHDISETHIKNIEQLFHQNCIRYSQSTIDNIKDFNVLIIDNIGILSNIYQYSDIALIGGGFKNALHNILEPASFGNVVFFGPQHQKYHEAKDLMDYNGGFEITDVKDFEKKLHITTSDIDKYKKNCSNFVKNNIGATSTILSFLN